MQGHKIEVGTSRSDGHSSNFFPFLYSLSLWYLLNFLIIFKLKAHEYVFDIIKLSCNNDLKVFSIPKFITII